MASFDSDEEQLEALKRWWNENGTSLMVGVVIVLAIYFGIGQFQNARTSEIGRASDLYQQLSAMALSGMSQALPEEDLQIAQAAYGELKSDHSDSIYSRYGALIMARFLVENGQSEVAESELQWILDNPDLGFMNKADEELFVITRLRLARIKISLGEVQQALSLIQAEPVGEEFVPGYAEVEGDIQLALGNVDAARESYQRALTALEASGTGNPLLIRLKLQDLGVKPAELM